MHFCCHLTTHQRSNLFNADCATTYLGHTRSDDGLMQPKVISRHLHPKRTPFLTLLVPTRSFWETGVVHRITYSFCYLFLLVYILNLLLIKWTKSCCIQLNNQIIFHQNNSHLYFLTHTSLTRLTSLPDCSRPLSAANVFSFQSLPVQPFLPIANGSWTYVDRPSATGGSKLDKQLYQKCSATACTNIYGNASIIWFVIPVVSL